MDYLPELRRLEHQLELAHRAVSFIADGVIVARLRFRRGDQRQTSQTESQRHGRGDQEAGARTLAGSGQPVGRDLEFWHRAEREVKDREPKATDQEST